MSATEADREKAMSLVPDHQGWCQFAIHGDCCDGECDCGTSEAHDAVAEALAAERVKARAPFLALADELEDDGDHTSVMISGAIRRAAEDAR